MHLHSHAKEVSRVTKLLFWLTLSVAKASKISNVNVTVLNACLIIESNPNSDDDLYEYRRAGAAIDLAVEYVNDNVLPAEFKLTKSYKTAGARCHSVRSTIASAMQLVAEGVVCNIYIGPSCGTNVGALYNIAAFQKVPLIGVPAASLESGSVDESREDMFPYLARTSMNTEHLSQTLISFLTRHNFTRSTIFTDETENFFVELKDAMFAAYDKFSPVLKFNSKFRFFRPANKTINVDIMTSLMKDGSQTSRVFVIVANATIVRQFMLLAKSLNMTNGDYFFAGFEPFPSTYWGNYTWENRDSYDEDARQAYKYLAVFSLDSQLVTQSKDDPHPKIKDITAVLQKRSQEDYNVSLEADILHDQVVTGYFHAVVLYGNIIQKLVAKKQDYTDGSLVVKSMQSTSFHSPVIGEAVMDDEYDLVNKYTVKFMDLSTGLYEAIVVVSRVSEEVQGFDFINRAHKRTWFDQNTLPPDVPFCGFFGNDPKCSIINSDSRQLLTATLAAVGVLVIIIAVSAFVIKRMQKVVTDPYWWRISIEDLRVQNRLASRSSKSLGDKDQELLEDGFQRMAFYRGNKVNIEDVKPLQIAAGNDVLKLMTQIKYVTHSNLLKFVGIAQAANHLCAYIVTEHASKGTLKSVFSNDNIKLDWHFQQSMITDIAKGMEYLHQSVLQSHGFLMETTCAVDGRFTVKITDYGLYCFKQTKDLLPVTGKEHERDYLILLWRAPELLRQVMSANGSQKGDVYSFGILLQQIILCSDPYEEEADSGHGHESVAAIVLTVQAGSVPYCRPKVPKDKCPKEQLYDLMVQCWAELPSERPTFTKILEMLRKGVGTNERGIVDHLIMRMEQYANNLETLVDTRTQQFMEEKQRSENLLRRLLPKSIAEALTKGLPTYPESYDNATIFFSDIVGFTTISASATPMNVVTLLNALYTLFDSVIDCYDVYKVETIGDAYMVCSGLPIRNGHQHVKEIARMSLRLRSEIVTFRIPHEPETNLQVRIGFHSGPCAAGAVGLKTPRYCLFGDTVNTASRMESNGEAMKIHISESSKTQLDRFVTDTMDKYFVTTERGLQEIKGKGQMLTFWLDDVRTLKSVNNEPYYYAPTESLLMTKMSLGMAHEVPTESYIRDPLIYLN